MVRSISFIYALLFLLMSSVSLKSQINRAERYVRNNEFHKALPLYYRYWKKNQFDNNVIRKMADINRTLNNSHEAEKWYRKLYEANYATTDDLYEYLKLMQYNRKSRSVYHMLEKFKGQDIDLNPYFLEKSALDSLLKRRSDIKLNTVSFNMNDYSEISPVFYTNNRLVFMSNREGDIMIDRKDSRTLKPYYNLYIINKAPIGYDFNGEAEIFSSNALSSLNDGPLCFNKDMDEVFFTRNVKEKNESKKKVYRLKLFTGTIVSGKLTNVTLLPFNEYGSSFSHPTLSYDSKTLYFVSDLPGGYGGMDIYKISRDDNGVWKDIENLGEKVNTRDNETSPYITKSGELLFSSRGLPGIGGYDLFMYWPDDTIQAKNIGAPINSLKDDLDIILNGSEGYFASNRREENNDEIYYFYASNALALKDKNKPVVEDVVEEIIVDDGLGVPIKVGDDLSKVLNLKPIYFEFNSDVLTEESKEELDRIIDLLNKSKFMEIDLRAHTDSRGADWYNQKLSDRRAQSAIQYLAERIVSPYRVTGKGYGESQLLNDCVSGRQCSEEEHAINRRVEFIILKMK